MKSKLLTSSALLTGLMLSSKLFAQDSTMTTEMKPFSPASSYRTWSIGASAGVLSPIGLIGKNDFNEWNADFGYGGYIKKQILPGFALRADYLRGQLSGDNSANGQFSSFETQLNYAATLSAEFILANINWLHRTSVIRPYATIGGGIAAYKPKLTTTGGQVVSGSDVGNIHEVAVPIGTGLKFALSKGINLDLGYTMTLLDGDNLDGFRNGPQNDKYSYGHLGLEFALGNKSKPALAAHNPVADMERDYNAKYDDLKAQMETERANNAQQLAAMQSKLDNMTKDSDGDGVIDALDKCPDTPANTKVDGAGCPLPEAKAPVRVYVTEEDKRIVKEAIDNLEFDFGKATIRARSYPSLNRVADLLVSKNFSLKLAGHTDNVGSDAANMKLSKARAESIKSYLVSKGVNASRVEATGYGESQPISTNATAEGRQQNRRVEFTLY